MKNNNYVTTKQAADILGLTEYTIRKKIRNNEITAIPGASVRNGYKINKESLLNFAKEHHINIITSSEILRFVKGLNLLDDKNMISTTKKEKIYDLGIQRLKSDIEGINLQIQSLELEDTTIDKEKKIIELRMKINKLDKTIQEIEILKEMTLA